jgi:hypothetical protein
MTVRELIEMLRDLPDQDAKVVVADGISATRWLAATGIVDQGVTACRCNPDFLEPGRERAVEIV